MNSTGMQINLDPSESASRDSSSKGLSSEEDAPYHISFSTGFGQGDQLIPDPFQLSSSVNSMHEEPVEMNTSTIRPAASRRYSMMSEISSTIESDSVDGADMPESLPINAETEVYDRFYKDALEDPLAPTEERRPQTPPRGKSSFFCDEFLATVRSPIKKGDFYAAASPTKSGKLPSRGLSRGLPEAFYRKASIKHSHTQILQRYPQKMASETTRQRFHEDLTETMGYDHDGSTETVSDWSDEDAEFFSHRPTSHSDRSQDTNEQLHNQAKDSSGGRLSEKFSTGNNGKVDKMISKHLLEVYERHNVREKVCRQDWLEDSLLDFTIPC